MWISAQTWLCTNDTEMQKIKDFRHAVPESINMLIDERRKSEPAVTKLGTDLAVPDCSLRDLMALYQRDLAAESLEYVIFGHIGNSHCHVNILPRNIRDYERGKELYLRWALAVVGMGGTVSGGYCNRAASVGENYAVPWGFR